MICYWIVVWCTFCILASHSPSLCDTTVTEKFEIMYDPFRVLNFTDNDKAASKSEMSILVKINPWDPAHRTRYRRRLIFSVFSILHVPCPECCSLCEKHYYTIQAGDTRATRTLVPLDLYGALAQILTILIGFSSMCVPLQSHFGNMNVEWIYWMIFSLNFINLLSYCSIWVMGHKNMSLRPWLLSYQKWDGWVWHQL